MYGKKLAFQSIILSEYTGVEQVEDIAENVQDMSHKKIKFSSVFHCRRYY